MNQFRSHFFNQIHDSKNELVHSFLYFFSINSSRTSNQKSKYQLFISIAKASMLTSTTVRYIYRRFHRHLALLQCPSLCHKLNFIKTKFIILWNCSTTYHKNTSYKCTQQSHKVLNVFFLCNIKQHTVCSFCEHATKLCTVLLPFIF